MAAAIQAQHHRVGVNMGDHAETIVNAIEVLPDETVEALAQRVLDDQPYRGDRPYDDFIVVRIVKPAASEDRPF